MINLYYKFITNGIPKDALYLFGNTKEEQVEVIRLYYHGIIRKDTILFCLLVFVPLILNLYLKWQWLQLLVVFCQIVAIEYFRKGIILCKSFLTH